MSESAAARLDRGFAQATVHALWRYPVKSLQGEALSRAEVGVEGLVGDRRYAIFDSHTGFGVTARRSPELLFATGRLREDGSAEITLPDGSISTGDSDLSDWLGRAVTLRRADEPGQRKYESPQDFENEPESTWNAFNGSPGAFHDLADASVSVLARASLDPHDGSAGWDSRRFRANVLVDLGEHTEDLLVGQELSLGDACLAIRRRLGRCVITTRPQPGGIGKDLDVLRTINRERGGRLAVGALVSRPGALSVGDRFRYAIGDPEPG